VPKLPEAQEIPAPVLDSAMIIELDTMPMEPDTFVIDTFPADTFVIDTMPPPPDTLPPDTTIRPDVLSD
jgi:hypothetical protein